MLFRSQRSASGDDIVSGCSRIFANLIVLMRRANQGGKVFRGRDIAARQAGGIGIPRATHAEFRRLFSAQRRAVDRVDNVLGRMRLHERPRSGLAMTDVIAHVKAFVWLNYRVRVVAHPVESLLMLRGQYALICLLWAEYRRNISGVDAADRRMAFRRPGATVGLRNGQSAQQLARSHSRACPMS